MSDEQIWLSAAGDVRGANALQFIPRAGAVASEVMLLATAVTHVDAWTACAWRTVIEYHGRVRCVRVVLTPPKDASVCRTIVGLLGQELPKDLCYANDADVPASRAPRTVILPATAIRSFDEADLISGILPQLGAAFPSRAMRFVEAAFGELVDNAIEWGRGSPVGAVVAAFHERDAHELQLVVTDLGALFVPDEETHLELERLARDSVSNAGGWGSLAGMAERRGLEATLEIAAGSGRLSWRGGEWSAVQTQLVGGFTAGVSVGL